MQKKITNQLVQLGLTKQEIATYNKLIQYGALTSKELAAKLHIFPHTVYRTARGLISKRFIEIQKKSPITYQAYPPELCISTLAKHKIRSIQHLIQDIEGETSEGKQKNDSTKINLIYGKERIFDLGADLLEKSQKEMLVISIGEEITPNLLLAVIQAKQRGVVIRMIAHKNDKGNRQVLKNLKMNGYEMRFFPDGGFHLAIYDSEKALIIIDDPKDLNQRVAVYIISFGLAKALRDYFYSVWDKATIL